MPNLSLRNALSRLRIYVGMSEVSKTGKRVTEGQDWLPDSPVVARPYCPICEPEADQMAEMLETRYCESHCPSRGGESDGEVNAQSYMSGSAEAGGADNKAYCDFFHRKVEPKREAPIPPTD